MNKYSQENCVHLKTSFESDIIKAKCKKQKVIEDPVGYILHRSL